MQGLKKILLGLVLAVAVFVGMSFQAREASALTCGASGPPGNTCYVWMPDFPPGGRYCTGAPAAGEINIYTQPNTGGFCVTLPARMGWWTFTGAQGNGWYGWAYVKTIVVGSAAGGGYVCTGPNGTGSCYSLWSGYTFNYTNPPYAANAPGWQSIVIPNW